MKAKWICGVVFTALLFSAVTPLTFSWDYNECMDDCDLQYFYCKQECLTLEPEYIHECTQACTRQFIRCSVSCRWT